MYIIILINSFFRSSNSRMQENSDKKVLRCMMVELGITKYFWSMN